MIYLYNCFYANNMFLVLCFCIVICHYNLKLDVLYVKRGVKKEKSRKRGAWNLEIHFRFNYFRYILY